MIHVITGPPCGGKSTYLKEHAREGALRIDYDDIAQTLGAPKRYETKGLIKGAAMVARAAAIDRALADPDAEAWIIHTDPSESQREVYKMVGAEFIEIDPGYEECMRRAERDGRPQQTFDGIAAYYHSRKGGAMREHLYKSFEAKADDAGIISGYFSTYDVEPDSYGDIVTPGAFDETIKARKESGHPFPLCWNHDLDQIIGSVDPADIKETEKGPLISGKFFDSALAQEKRELVKSGVVYQFSFAYDIKECRKPTEEEKAKGIQNVLTKLDLFEISIVPIPANQHAEVTEVKAGRRNSKADADAIREAISLLQGVLGELEDNGDGEDEAKANTAVEEPERSNPRAEDLLTRIKKMEVEK